MAKKTNKTIKNIWVVSREYEGLAGSGGVKDVCRQLAEALALAKKSVKVVLPLYGFMNPGELGFTLLDIVLEVDMPYVGQERREKVTFWTGKRAGVQIFLVDAERYWEKRGIYTYTAEEAARDPLHHQGSAYHDYFAMNILLQKAAVSLMIRLDEKPDIIHCHDGHTAVLPAMIREIEGFREYFRQTGTLVTVHNAGLGYHQEVGDLPFAKTITGLPYSVVLDSLLAGQFNPFLAASSYAVLNTVSENYARELQETDNDLLTGWLGHRLLSTGVRLAGITNGISPADFDPSQPKRLGITAGFNPGQGDLAGKLRCKKALLKDIGNQAIQEISQIGTLANTPAQPLFTMISRLTSQKGVDIMIQALAKLLAADRKFQVLIQGVGAREMEDALIRLIELPENQGRICLMLGYNQALANRVYAAGDFFIIPSRYEPCGLTDYIAQLFGNIPVVHHVGGLVKVEDGVSGFAFQEHTPEALLETMARAIGIFRSDPQRIIAMQKAAVDLIHREYTWSRIMKRYLTLYQAARDLAGKQQAEKNGPAEQEAAEHPGHLPIPHPY